MSSSNTFALKDAASIWGQPYPFMVPTLDFVFPLSIIQPSMVWPLCRVEGTENYVMLVSCLGEPRYLASQTDKQEANSMLISLELGWSDYKLRQVVVRADTSRDLINIFLESERMGRSNEAGKWGGVWEEWMIVEEGVDHEVLS